MMFCNRWNSPPLNTSIEQQVEAPHASTTIVHAPMVDDEIICLQSISSIDHVFPHNMNTPLTIVELTMGLGITIVHPITQDTLIKTTNL